MNRLLSILVTLFILFLVYLWINHLMGSSESGKVKDETTTTTPIPEKTFEDHSDEYNIPDDYVPADSSPEQVEPAPEEKSSDVPATPAKQPESKTEDPAVVKTSPKPSAPVTPVQQPPAKSVDKDPGVHLVIAGNFLERANAEVRVKELKKLGYTKAEVVNFELSEYHTACAGRYSDLNEARRVAKKIKDMNGIDTYVRHGN